MRFLPLLLLASLPALAAEVPRIFHPGQLPNDARLAPLKDLDGYFPFTPPENRETWEKRAEEVRRQIRVSQGIWPEPTKTPLNAVIHGRREQDGYTVEKVFFEAMPGFFVTGNLYRPKGEPAAGTKRPGVLCPHGHWADGRFHDAGVEATKKAIEAGGEKFADSGRSPLQARCVHLARMGCVVFHYDMIGYADSVQITQKLAHGFAKQRPEMNSSEAWGLFSPQAESHLQSVMGLQTWSSIRALDFLTALPDVDAARIACTGASGGGTQTFILAAIDPRVTVQFPAVMVSTAMQGGCTCENASLLRVGTGNIELAALFAPKPLGMTAADDWTKAMETKGFPELKKHYAMMGAPDHVRLWPLLQFGHNYNAPSRAGMYAWLNVHLKLGLSAEQLEERDFQRLSKAEMTVWDAQHPAPAADDVELEKRLLRWWRDDARKQIETDIPALKKSAQPAIATIIGRSFDTVGEVKIRAAKEAKLPSLESGLEAEAAIYGNSTHGEEVPVITIRPPGAVGGSVLVLSADGKAGALSGTSITWALAKAGLTVHATDLFQQGEFLPEGASDTPTRTVKNPRESVSYTLGYNHPLFAQRVHDVLTVAKASAGAKPLAIVGFDPTASAIAAAAAAVAPGAFKAIVLDTGGFRFSDVKDIRDPMLFPGGAKYGDLPGLLALAAPTKLFLMGEGRTGPDLVTAGYEVAGVPNTLRVSEKLDHDAAVKWLLEALR